MFELPAEYLNRMREMLGDEYPAFLHAMEKPPALALRLNPNRPESESAAHPFSEASVPWEPLGRYLLPGAKPGAAIAHWAGGYYLQEASAMIPARVMNARPGERILDLCAAPGGKSTQLAAAMNHEGVLVANDPELSRARILAGNLERLGATNAVVVSALPDKLVPHWAETFDAILVDAPCSGEGMFRRDLAARQEWKPAAPLGCAARQAGILDCAAEMLRPGGRLVYATCTLNRLENEDGIAAFLSRHPDFTPEDFKLEGLPPSCGGMLKVFPHRVRGDGHFVARLRKAGESRVKGPAPAKSEAGAQRLLEGLSREICTPPPWLASMRCFLSGDRLYAVSQDAPTLEGLRVVSPGLFILRAGRSHIEPQHALAMALPSGLARHEADLDDVQARAFLAGEALPTEHDDGWTWIHWKGLPLGWGKASGGTLKNHLPKGLRRTVTA